MNRRARGFFGGRSEAEVGLGQDGDPSDRPLERRRPVPRPCPCPRHAPGEPQLLPRGRKPPCPPMERKSWTPRARALASKSVRSMGPSCAREKSAVPSRRLPLGESAAPEKWKSSAAASPRRLSRPRPSARPSSPVPPWTWTSVLSAVEHAVPAVACEDAGEARAEDPVVARGQAAHGAKAPLVRVSPPNTSKSPRGRPRHGPRASSPRKSRRAGHGSQGRRGGRPAKGGRRGRRIAAFRCRRGWDGRRRNRRGACRGPRPSRRDRKWSSWSRPPLQGVVSWPEAGFRSGGGAWVKRRQFSSPAWRIAARIRSRVGSSIGTRGRRISSWHLPSRDRANLVGQGFGSAKAARCSGSSRSW